MGDVYFYLVKPVLTEVGLLDFVGNLVMLALCVFGWRQESAPLGEILMKETT